MDKIISQIQKIKPTLKLNSIKTYLVSLKYIAKNCSENPENFPENPNFLNDTTNVIHCIKDQPITTRKNRLTAIVVYLKSFQDDKYLKLIDTYAKAMESDADKYKTIINKQEFSDKQKKNLITMDEFKDVIDKMFDDIKREKLYKKNELDNKEYNQLQNYIVLRLYLEYPFRNNFSDTKIISTKKEDDGNYNYMLVRDNSVYFILNKYKTDKKYGKKIYKLPADLSSLIRLLLKHNTSGYLLTKYNRKDSLSPNDLTKLLNRIFYKYTGKKIGSSLLRHIRISDERKNDPTIKELEEKNKRIEDLFQHNNSMNNEYRKIK